MQSSKLINLLKVLTPDEFRDFEKFTGSPFFSKGRDLLPFLKVLKNFYPDFKNDNLKAEFIFRKLFPGKRFDTIRSANVIKTLSSQLFLLCKDYLIHLEFKDDESRKHFYLLSQLRKKKMYLEFDKDLKSLKNENNIHKGSIRDFLDKYFIETAIRDNRLDRDEFENSFESNLKSSEYTLLAGLINTFKHQDELNVAKGYNLNVRSNLMEFVLDSIDLEKFIDTFKKSNHPMYQFLEVYYFIYKMNKYPESRENYFILRDILQQRACLFCQSENYVLWNIMLSYCNIHNLHLEEHFFIYNYILENKVYKKSDEEDFHIVLFRNIIVVSSFLSKTEWLEKFINEYSYEIHIEHRSDMLNFSNAMLNFMKGNFNSALEYILKIKYELFLYKIDVRTLQLKIYYKLGYYDQLFSVIDSTLHFLKINKELRPEFSKSTKNFIKYLKEFVKLNLGNSISKSELNYLKKSISDELYLGQKYWLLSEADLI